RRYYEDRHEPQDHRGRSWKETGNADVILPQREVQLYLLAMAVDAVNVAAAPVPFEKVILFFRFLYAFSVDGHDGEVFGHADALQNAVIPHLEHLHAVICGFELSAQFIRAYNVTAD